MDTNAFLHQFDRIYVINLAHRADRWLRIDSMLRALGISHHTRIDAVKDDDSIAGCFQSHVKALEQAVQDKASCPLFLEDDALIAHSNSIDFSWSHIKDCDFLYLGYNLDPDNKGTGIPVLQNNYLKLNGCYTTHAYCVVPSVIPGLLQRLDRAYHAEGMRTIDLAYILLSNRYTMYGLYPMLFTQAAGYSDINHHDVNYTLEDNVRQALVNSKQT